MDETTTLQIEAKLERERTNIALLEQNLEKYNSLTINASNILQNFEQRLLKVEQNVFPLYNVTKSLECQQKNLDVVIKKLDGVLQHYSCSQENFNIIQLGPDSENIGLYLEALNKLKRAKDYFLTTGTGTVELENVTHLYNNGCDVLNQYFKQLIRRHSSPLKPIDLIDLIYMEEDTSDDNSQYSASSIRQLPQETRKELKIIVDWLDENLRREYMTIYSDERSDIIYRSLIMLKDHQKASSLGNDSGMKVKSYGRLSLNDSGGKKKLQSIFEKKANKMFAKANLLKKPLNLSNDNFLNEDMYGENNDMELEKYLVLLLGLQKLLVLERQILNEIIPSSRQNEVFFNVGMTSIDMIVKDAEAITSRVMKSISKKEWSAALGVFSAMKHVNLLQPDIEKICNQEQKSQLSGVMNRFHSTGKSALDQFIDSIKSEGSSSQVPLTSTGSFPKDATVHQLTSDTIWFLEHLYPYYDIIGPVLINDTVYSQPLQQIMNFKSFNDDQKNRALCGIYFRKVLTELNFTIITKADQIYNNDATCQLFKLNNIYYILKSLQRNNLLDVVKFTEVDSEKRYLKMIDDLKHAYQQTWQKLLVHITPIEDCPKASGGKLKDKDRAIVKEKFANFNREFDESCRNQRSISVPDILLREGLKRDNSETLVPHYNAFYDLYADVEFAKNREKYVRYTPHHFAMALMSIFDDRN
ncbi:CLUMA_CG001994, isoform A, partial [Clunio marinus]